LDNRTGSRVLPFDVDLLRQAGGKAAGGQINGTPEEPADNVVIMMLR